MELITISKLSRDFGVSTRMLRYYEQIGLLTSHKADDYAYRMYDGRAVARLRQIILLRKLRIPLKQISRICENRDSGTILEVFAESVREIDDEMTALSTMRLILQRFIGELKVRTGISLESVLLDSEAMLSALNSLSMTKISFKEERSMNELNKAHETLSALDRVRIVRLPPFTVASYHFIGENPEQTVGDRIGKFAKEAGLYEIKPDARVFGFNHPNPSEDGRPYGYETWVTIPDSLDVPAPLTKKRFQGGLYAAHTINFPDFQEWGDLEKWVEKSDRYQPNYAPEGMEIMDGLLEEHLNWVYANHLGWPENGIDGQIDLLFPVKPR